MAINVKDLRGMTTALYMVDYPTFAKAFKEAGGSPSMANHLWIKWKETHHDNFLWEYGNMDLENQRRTTEVINKLIKLQEDRQAQKKYSHKAWKEYSAGKLGKVV